MTNIDKDEDINLRTVQQRGSAIRHIENPSEAVQLAAINNMPMAIRFIKKPSEAAQLAAVRQTGRFIASIENPTESARLAAFVSGGPEIVDLPCMFRNIVPSALDLADAFRNATHRFDFSAPIAPTTQGDDDKHTSGMKLMLEILRNQPPADILVLHEAAPGLFENTALTELLRDILRDQASPNRTPPVSRSM